MAGMGHVDKGGRPLIQALSPSLTMIKISVGPMDNNAYLLQPKSGPGVLIDAANDHDRLLEMIDGQAIAAIVTTHRHDDHLHALKSVWEQTDAILIAGQSDAQAIASSTGVRLPQQVWDGDTVGVGDENLSVIGLVGHTPGSIALAYAPDQGPAHLFTGDSLFPGGPGRTWSPGAFTTLIDDLTAKIFDTFGDDTVVHPGHGDDTTVGTERPHVDEWRARGW